MELGSVENPRAPDSQSQSQSQSQYQSLHVSQRRHEHLPQDTPVQSFTARIVHKRKLGKTLCFLDVESLVAPTYGSIVASFDHEYHHNHQTQHHGNHSYELTHQIHHDDNKKEQSVLSNNSHHIAKFFKPKNDTDNDCIIDNDKIKNKSSNRDTASNSDNDRETNKNYITKSSSTIQVLLSFDTWSQGRQKYLQQHFSSDKLAIESFNYHLDVLRIGSIVEMHCISSSYINLDQQNQGTCQDLCLLDAEVQYPDPSLVALDKFLAYCTSKTNTTYVSTQFIASAFCTSLENIHTLIDFQARIDSLSEMIKDRLQIHCQHQHHPPTSTDVDWTKSKRQQDGKDDNLRQLVQLTKKQKMLKKQIIRSFKGLPPTIQRKRRTSSYEMHVVFSSYSKLSQDGWLSSKSSLFHQYCSNVMHAQSDSLIWNTETEKLTNTTITGPSNGTHNISSPTTTTPLHALGLNLDWARVDPVLNLADPEKKSSRGPSTRSEYCNNKKRPQIEWMMHFIYKVLCEMSSRQPGHHTENAKSMAFRVLDVGGGRGDLTVALAHTFPQCQFTIIDVNEKSLEAGRRRAQALALANISCCFKSIEQLIDTGNQQGDEESRPWDAVIGLHTCGYLTDAILAYSARCSRSFIICPCCYGKNNQLRSLYIPQAVNTHNQDSEPHSEDVLNRLAESNDPVGSKHAQLLINASRIKKLFQYLPWHWGIQEFPSDYSQRNLVLTGHL